MEPVNANMGTLMMELIGHVFHVLLYLLVANIANMIILQEEILALPDLLV